jgi:hypothetical protein
MLTKKRGGTRKKERCSKYASFCGGGDLLKIPGSVALFLANGILYDSYSLLVIGSCMEEERVVAHSLVLPLIFSAL